MIDPGYAVLHCVARRQHEDGNIVTRMSEFTADTESVPAGQNHVKDDQIVSIVPGQCEGALAIAGDFGLVTLLTQAHGQHRGGLRLVLYDQNPHCKRPLRPDFTPCVQPAVWNVKRHASGAQL